jgi:hypothetical protein
MKIEAHYDHVSHELLSVEEYQKSLCQTYQTLSKNITIHDDVLVVKQSAEVVHYYARKNNSQNYQIIESISGHVRTHQQNTKPFDSRIVTRTQNLYGNVCLIVVFDHYWHWLYETMLQFVLYHEILVGNPDERTMRFLLTDSVTDQKYLQVMNRFGINCNVCLQMEEGIGYQVHGRMYHIQIQEGFPQPWLLDYYKTHLVQQVTDVTDLIYISRKNTSRRRVINEDALIQMLQSKFNFVVPCVEHMDFEQQIKMTHRARVYMSFNGTGFSANLPFTSHRQVVTIELIGHKVHTKTGFVIAQHFNLKHYCVHAVKSSTNDNNITVDLGRIEKSLESIFKIEKIHKDR